MRLNALKLSEEQPNAATAAIVGPIELRLLLSRLKTLISLRPDVVMPA